MAGCYPFFQLTINGLTQVVDEDFDEGFIPLTIAGHAVRVEIVQELADRQRVVYIIIPVIGGYVVVKISVERRRIPYRVGIRKIPLVRSRQLARKTIMSRYGNANTVSLIDRTDIPDIFTQDLNAQVYPGIDVIFNLRIVGMNDQPEEDDVVNDALLASFATIRLA